MSETDDLEILTNTEETEDIQKKSKIPVTKKKLVIKTQPAKEVMEEEEEEEIMTPKPIIKKAPAKKERTEAQKLAFERCKKQREANAKKRAEDAKKLMEYEKKALEEKLIAKAVSLKKKQIKKQVILDEISDDETPIEKVKEMAKKIKPVEKPKPAFTFI
jgi:hypothetical protein